MNQFLQRACTILELLSPQPTNLEKACRLGSNNDGGYIMIDDITAQDFLISMGVGDDINFERALSKKVMGTHLYDFSIEALPELIENSQFFPERIGSKDSTSLDTTVARAPKSADLLLKMDIEGSEWETLKNTESKTLTKFRQIVVEFHWLENIFNDQYYETALEVLQKLSKTHFVLNAHPNNNGDTIIVENLLFPGVIEISYLRRESYQIYSGTLDSGDSTCFDLNRPCNPNLPELYLQARKFREQLDLETISVGTFSRQGIGQNPDELVGLRFQLQALLDEKQILVRQLEEILDSRIWRFSRFYRRLRKK